MSLPVIEKVDRYDHKIPQKCYAKWVNDPENPLWRKVSMRYTEGQVFQTHASISTTESSGTVPYSKWVSVEEGPLGRGLVH